MLEGRQVLVVEREFLVAMDLQRILETARAGSIFFVRNAEEVTAGVAKWQDIELAIIETSVAEGSANLVDRLRAAGVAVVLTADAVSGPPVPGTLRKPIVESEFLAACVAALGALR